MTNYIAKLISWRREPSRPLLPSERLERAAALRRYFNQAVLVIFPILGGLAAWGIAAQDPSVYLGTAIVRLEMNPLKGGMRLKNQAYGDEIAIMLSEPGLQTAVDTLSQEDRQKLSRKEGGHKARRQSSTDPDAHLRATLRAGLRAERIPHTAMLRISFTSPDPQLAGEIPNTVVRAMMLVNLDKAKRRTGRAEAFFRTPVKALQDEVQAFRLKEHSLAEGLLTPTLPPPAAPPPLDPFLAARAARKGARTATSSETTPPPAPRNSEYESQAAILSAFTTELHRSQREKQLTSLQAGMLAKANEQNRNVFDDGANDLSRAITAAMSRYDSLAATLSQHHPEMAAEAAEIEQLQAEIRALRTRQLELAKVKVLIASGKVTRLLQGTQKEQTLLAEIIDRQRRNNLLYQNIAVEESVLQTLEPGCNPPGLRRL
ncbi:GumC domain-containing protein [Granulicella tundricola]|uniref:Lipopolysaccharide biosynthesis protein n=1 Tax=Granulicella tundricola (strain ATCC BAA-1859 / DSM 23138 / MP5ACTX9) TaxID=1198114 RepID=E8X0J8_GRATM|nr:LPS biosynthesis protein [Granulicella tundricola]ADW67862.1 lipopolysaccharide biosynthesis protein [Granulicella tundricola MP5ACTX9]